MLGIHDAFHLFLLELRICLLYLHVYMYLGIVTKQIFDDSHGSIRLHQYTV